MVFVKSCLLTRRRVEPFTDKQIQLLFDSLGKKLKDNAPPAQIKSTVSGML
jgi:hypothetical protein